MSQSAIEPVGQPTGAPTLEVPSQRRFRFDNRYIAPLFISFILLVGHLFYGILESYERTALAIVAALITELVLGRIFFGKWLNLASAYITGISVGILIRSPAFWPFALCSVLSIMSKYVLRVKGRHLWNPSNFGICVLLFLAADTVAALTIQWGNFIWPMLVIWTLGSIIIWRAKRFHISATYVVSFFAFALLRSWITGDPWRSEISPITGPMYQLFVFFMITDPKTTVKSKKWQCVVVFFVAFVEMLLRLNQVVYAPVYALFLVGPAAMLIEIWFESSHKKAQKAQKLAENLLCLLCFFVAGFVFGGCKQQPAIVTPTANPAAEQAVASPSPSPTPPRPSGPIEFTDVTAEAGIHFKHNSGAFGKKYLPETIGAGAAFIDYDNDGWQDIFLVNSMDWPENKKRKSFPALYHNNKDGTFTDVTHQVGLGVEMYGIGVAIADYDNDGNEDIYVTCVGPNHLFRNLGGKFADVTNRAGVGDPGFSTSAAWFDYDNDGKLDLFVGNYVEWSVQTDQFCTLDGKNKSYCTPQTYKGQSPTLYHNRGNGTFENVTARAGLNDPAGKTLGVALLDYDDDGWMDLFVANDTEPNKLYRNNHNGTFTDNAVIAGVAFSESGTARAGMGVDAADYDGSGKQSVVIGNFTNESIALYHNDGSGLFTDEAPASGIGKISAQSLTFACFFFDYDLDGLLDIFAANGHVSDDISVVQPTVKYAQPPHLFHNRGRKKFEEVTAKLGRALNRAIVGRGAAYGDFDNDGDLDLVVTTNNGPARLLRNDNANQNDLLRVKTVGTRSNRDGIGAKVVVKTLKGKTLFAMVRTGSSYCSQSELPLTFGLGKPEEGTTLNIEITWPGGQKETIANVKANQFVVVQEGKGLVTQEQIVFARKPST